MKNLKLDAYVIGLRKLNKGEKDSGAWVDLTQDREEVEEYIDTIVGYDSCTIYDFETSLAIDVKTGTDIYILLDLVEVLKATDYPESVVNNILEQCSNIENVIDIINNQSFDCYDEIKNEEDLGYILAEFLELPEIGRRYFNYENYGRDAVFEGWHIDCGAAVYIY